MGWIEKREGKRGTTYAVYWRDPSGRRHSQTFLTAREAKDEKLEQTRRERHGASYAKPETFGDFAGLDVDEDGRVQLGGDGWFERHRRAVRPSTFDRRSASRKHLEPFISLRVDRITPSVVDDAVTKVAAKHPRQAQLLLETVKVILRDARVRGQRINEDVLQLRAPKYEARDPRFLTSRQVEILADASSEPHLVRVAAYTGLRQGELFALRDEDLDLKRATLQVTHTLYKGELGRLKTKAARRSVPLPPIVLQEIRAQLLHRPRGTEFVFPAPKGGPWDRAEMSRRFKTWGKNAQLEGVVFHDLRHTFASLAIKSGAHPKVLQELMGHETWQVTMDRYGHLFPGHKETAMKDLNRLLMRESAKAHASSS